MKSWLLAIRPKTLSAAVVPVLVTTALAYGNGFTMNWWICLSACISTLCIQIATNLFNDAIDFDKGADAKNRLGPIRVTQAGLLSRKQVYLLGLGFCLLAAISGIYLILQGGTPLLWIGLVSIVFTYLYTGGPFPLAYLGLGDFFVLFFFGWVACLSMYYLYTQEIAVSALVLGTQLGLLCTVLIAINNFRDYESDRLVAKNTLAARFGPRFVRIEISSMYVIVFLLQMYWYYQQKYLAAFLPLLLLPFAFHICKFLWKHSPSATFNLYLAKSSLLYLLFGLLFSLGYIWSMT